MPYQKRDTWYVYAFDEKTGRSKPRATTARSAREAASFEKTQAARDELTRQVWRERQARLAAGESTFAEAFERYERLARVESTTIHGSVRLHTFPVMASRLAFEITSDDWTAHFNDLVKVDLLAPASINRMRGCIQQVYASARIKPNPIDDAKPLKVVRRPAATLDGDEVQRVFAKIAAHHQPKFALELVFASRKGAVLGLRRQDVDVKTHVVRLFESKVKKYIDFDVPASVWPFVQQALDAAKGDYLFTTEDGKPYANGNDNLVEVLRAACVAAGVIIGWRNTCRRSGCGFVEEAQKPNRDPCPKCGFKLSAYGIPRPVTFRSLRTSVATILRKLGTDLGDVQRLLGHASPATTTRFYDQDDGTAARRAVKALPYDLSAVVGATQALPAPVLAGGAVTVSLGSRAGKLVGPNGFEPSTSSVSRNQQEWNEAASSGKQSDLRLFGLLDAYVAPTGATRNGTFGNDNATRNATGPDDVDALIRASTFGPWLARPAPSA